MEADPRAREAKKQLAPGAGVPTFDIEGEVLTGFSESRLHRTIRARAESNVDLGR